MGDDAVLRHALPLGRALGHATEGRQPLGAVLHHQMNSLHDYQNSTINIVKYSRYTSMTLATLGNPEARTERIRYSVTHSHKKDND